MTSATPGSDAEPLTFPLPLPVLPRFHSAFPLLTSSPASHRLQGRLLASVALYVAPARENTYVALTRHLLFQYRKVCVCVCVCVCVSLHVSDRA